MYFFLGCVGPADPERDALCEGAGEPSVTLGTGAGHSFDALEDGAEVELDIAPQGGFGVSVRASTSGLRADEAVEVFLEPLIDGESAGSFVNPAVQLYCQDDGSGLLWGVVVGFDPAVYSDNDDLLALAGQEVTLQVTITDLDGDAALGEVTVALTVGDR